MPLGGAKRYLTLETSSFRIFLIYLSSFPALSLGFPLKKNDAVDHDPGADEEKEKSRELHGWGGDFPFEFSVCLWWVKNIKLCT